MLTQIFLPPPPSSLVESVAGESEDAVTGGAVYSNSTSDDVLGSISDATPGAALDEKDELSDTSITPMALTDEIYFTIDADGTITDYSNAGPKDVEIPTVINGVTVKAIGDYVFAGLSITSVVIPEGVTSIGVNAFYNNLITSAIIPSTVINIAQGAFQVNALTGVTLPAGLTSLGSSAFDQNKLASIGIPTAIKSIPNAAFSNNLLTSVVFASGTTSIGDSAFAGNPNLTIDFSDTNLTSLASLGKSAFSGAGLTGDLVLPASLATIGSNAFYGNSGVTGVDVSTYYQGGIAGAPWGLSDAVPITWKDSGTCWLFNPETGILYGIKEAGHAGCTDPGLHASTDLVIPSVISGVSVKGIAANSFEAGTYTSITLPEGITSIGAYAFRGNTFVSAINIPSTVTDIAEGAFRNVGRSATGNTTVSFAAASQLKTIGTLAFSGMSKLKTISIPEGVTSIDNAFQADGLIDISLPSTLASLGAGAFASCASLVTVNINQVKDDLSGKGWAAPNWVLNCPHGGTETPLTINWTDVSETYDDSATILCDGTWHINTATGVLVNYYGTGGDVQIPGKLTIEGTDYEVKGIGYRLFYLNKTITSVSIPFTVLTVAESAFQGATNLVQADMSNATSLVSLGNSAFRNTGLESLDIPQSLALLGNNVFMDNKFLTGINVPENASLQTLPQNTFANCTNLGPEFTIPGSVTNIGSQAFYGCTGIETVYMGSKVAACNANAFNNCTSLESIHVDQYRSQAATTFKNNSPWSNQITAASVYWKGDEVTFVPDEAMVAGMPQHRTLDLALSMDVQAGNISRIWTTDAAGAAVVNMVSGLSSPTASYNATPVLPADYITANGTHYFACITNNGQVSYYSYDVTDIDTDAPKATHTVSNGKIHLTVTDGPGTGTTVKHLLASLSGDGIDTPITTFADDSGFSIDIDIVPGQSNYSYTIVDAEGNTTVYPLSLDRYTLAFDTNAATILSTPSIDTSSITREATLAWGTLPMPSATGYTFLGWNTAADGTGTMLDGTELATANLTVYAQWRADTYTVDFLNDGPNASHATITGDDRQQIAYRQNPNPNCTVAIKTEDVGSYELIGWSYTMTSDDGNVRTGTVTGAKGYEGVTVVGNVEFHAIIYKIPFVTIAVQNGLGSIAQNDAVAPTPTQSTQGTEGITYESLPISVNMKYLPASENYSLKSITVHDYQATPSVLSLEGSTLRSGSYHLPTLDRDGAAVTVTVEVDLDAGTITTDDTVGTSLAFEVAYEAIQTTYTLKHYVMNADGTYSTSPNSTNTMPTTGTVEAGSVAAVVPNSYSYANYDASLTTYQDSVVTTPQAAATTVKYDGSTVVNLYYARNSHAVTFDAQGHGSTPAPITDVLFGAYVTDPSNLSQDGYAFGGWYTDVACSDGDKWDFATNTMPNDDLILYAKWTENTAILHYASDNATMGSVSRSEESVPVVTGVPAGSIAAANSGYHFVKWTDADGNEVGTTTTFLPTKNAGDLWTDAAFTAVFEPNTYTVTFNANGGTGAMNDLSATYGSESTLPTNGFSRDGFTFAGWSTTPGATTPDYTDGASIINLTTEDGVTVVLYAVWTPNPVNPVDPTGSMGNSSSGDAASHAGELPITGDIRLFLILGLGGLACVAIVALILSRRKYGK